MLNVYNVNEYLSVLAATGVLTDLKIEPKLLRAEVKGLTFDNREVTEGAIFVCKGAHFKEEYLADAMKKGALLYVSETVYESVDAPYILVSDIRRAMAYLAVAYYNDAPAKLKTVGITGTKGKSTTAYYVKSVLDHYLATESAILSSIDNYDGVTKEESHLTTPEAMEIHRHCHNAAESGISHLVMEVSSQALKYDRVLGMNLTVGVFTNIGTDHISPIEHPDFEDYFASKLKIFGLCETACVNTDCEFADRILEAAKKEKCRLLTFGSHESDDIYCSHIEKKGDATWFTVRTPSCERDYCITMPGLFNVENALAAIAVAYVLGIPESAVAAGLEVARAAGRMETFSSRDGSCTVIIDYAHNKMSFEALFRSTRVEYPGKKIVSVYGCPGKKAFLRRHDLAVASGTYADHTIITEEDSGEEPFDSIAADLEKNLIETGGSYEIVEDREEAVRRAILEHGENAVILLTGKGRETRMKRGTLYIDTPSDVDYTEKFLAEYDRLAEEKETETANV